MATSFIQINDQPEEGFWAQDAFVEVMLLCLINEIEAQQLDKIPWIAEYKLELATQAIPVIYGGMSLLLEEFVNDYERRQVMVSLIDSIFAKIENKPNYFSGNNFHAMRKRAMEMLNNQYGWWNGDGELDRVVNTSGWQEWDITPVKSRYEHAFVLMRKLLLGEIGYKASDPEDYWI